MKDVITIVAIILSFVAYIKYIQTILKGDTKPHLFSWFLWSLIVAIVFFIQLQNGGGTGSYIMLAVFIFCAIITVLSFKNGKKNITKSDIAALIAALIAMALWLIVEQPLLSMIILCLIDIFSFIPTIRKSWGQPFSEPISTYSITAVRHILNLFALETFTAVTVMYPAYLILANLGIVLLLVLRRPIVVKSAPIL